MELSPSRSAAHNLAPGELDDDPRLIRVCDNVGIASVGRVTIPGYKIAHELYAFYSAFRSLKNDARKITVARSRLVPRGHRYEFGARW